MARRRKKKDLCDLTPEEYKQLKKETDERINRDYAPGNIVKAIHRDGAIPPGDLGICFMDVFISVVGSPVCVIWKAIFACGEEISLGYNTFENVVPTGQQSNIQEWIEKNVSETRKRRKRNS